MQTTEQTPLHPVTKSTTTCATHPVEVAVAVAQYSDIAYFSVVLANCRPGEKRKHNRQSGYIVAREDSASRVNASFCALYAQK